MGVEMRVEIRVEIRVETTDEMNRSFETLGFTAKVPLLMNTIA
jgi:hypothetical protein